MPKSKRNRVVSLAQTTKKGYETKKDLISQVQASCDEYASIYVFSVENMRNSKIKDVRQRWKTSRFFFGKNKVMSVGLGRSKEDEYKENLHQISERLVGNVGLMFTNADKEEVRSWFKTFSVPDYARSGNKATETIVLPEGALDQETYPHSMEPNLRQLGLPTQLKKGIIHLTEEFTVCKEGDTLTPEQCRILKLFYHTLVSFQIVLKCSWHTNGTFEEFDDS